MGSAGPGLSHRRPAKSQANLLIGVVSLELCCSKTFNKDTGDASDKNVCLPKHIGPFFPVPAH